MRSRNRAVGAALLVGSMSLGVIACGDDDEVSTPATADAAVPASTTAQPAEVETIKVAMYEGLVPFAPIFLGGDDYLGTFADEGVNVEYVYGMTSPLNLQAVVTGEADIGISNPVGIWGAIEQGQDLQVLGTVGKNGQVILFGKDSGVTPGDLEALVGKTGVAAGPLGQAQIQVQLTEAGLDPDSVSMVTADFSAMVSGFTAGQYDFIQVGDPTVTRLIDEIGAIKFYDPRGVDDPIGNIPGITIFAKRSWLEEHPDAAARFLRAVRENLRRADDDPEGTIETAMPGVTKQGDPELVKRTMPTEMQTWPAVPEMTEDQFDFVNNMMVDVLGEVEKPFEYDEVIWDQAPDIWNGG